MKKKCTFRFLRANYLKKIKENEKIIDKRNNPYFEIIHTGTWKIITAGQVCAEQNATVSY